MASKTSGPEVGHAYVTIMPEMAEFQRSIRKAIVDNLPKSFKQAAKSVDEQSRAIIRGLDDAFKQERLAREAEQTAKKAADAWIKEQERAEAEAEKAAAKAADVALAEAEKAAAAAAKAQDEHMQDWLTTQTRAFQTAEALAKSAAKERAKVTSEGIAGLQDLAGRIGSGANAVADKFIEVGRAAGQKFVEGFNATYGRVGSLMASLASSQIANAGQALGLKLGNGIAGGLSTAKLAIGSAIGNMISSAMGSISSATSSAVARIDTLENFPIIMEQMGVSADVTEKSVKALDAAIDGLPTTLDGIIGFTQNIFPSFGGDLDKATESAIAFNNALVAGGKDATLQANAMEQWSQMLAVGKVDMQAWRSVVSAMQGPMQQLAKYMGFANTTELYENLIGSKNGTIPLEELNQAFIDLNEGVEGYTSFADQAKVATGNLGTALGLIPTRLGKLEAQIMQYFGRSTLAETVNNFTSQFGKLGKLLTDEGGIFDTLGVKEYASAIESQLGGAFSRLKDVAGPAMETMLPLTKAGMSEGLEIISATLDHIVDKGTPFIEKVSGTLQELLQGAPQISDTLQPVIDSFIDMKFDTWTAALDMWQKIAAAVLPVLPQIIDATGKVNTAVADIVGDLAGPAAQAFAKIYSIVADLIDKNAPIIEKIGGKLAEILPTMAQQIADMVNAVAPFLPQVVGAFGSMVDTVGPAVTNIINTLAPHLPEIAETIASIANSLAPAVADMVAKAEPFISPALDLFEKAGTFVSDHLEGFLLLVGGIKAASAAVSGFSGLAKIIEDVTAIKALIGGEGGLLNMITGSGAGEAISGAVAAVGGIGPALGIVGGIAAIAGSLIYCWNTSEQFREGITGTLEAIQDAFGRLWEKVKPILEKMWDLLGTYIKPILETIAEVVGGLFLIAFQLAGAIIVGVLDSITVLLDGITTALDWLYHNLLEPVIGAFKDLFDWINKIEPPEWWNDFLGQLTGNTSVPSTRPMAEGGIATRPTRALIAEAGTPEAVVPLSAQGIQKFTSGLAPQYTSGGAPTVNIEIGNFINNDTNRDVRSLSEEIGRDTLRQLKQQGVYA